MFLVPRTNALQPGDALGRLQVQRAQHNALGRTRAAGETLVSCPFFTVRQRRMPAGETALDVGSLSAWMVLSGCGRVNDTPLAAGDTVLLFHPMSAELYTALAAIL